MCILTERFTRIIPVFLVTLIAHLLSVTTSGQTNGNLRIYPGSVLIISSETTLNVPETITIHATSEKTASLINKGSLNVAEANIESYLSSAGAGFRLVSSPVSDQSIKTFVINNSIPHKNIGGTDVYAMQSYSEASNDWTYFPYDGTPATSMGIGTGYSLLGQDAYVTYSGSSFNSGDINVLIYASTGTNLAWNSIGNPYASAIEVTGSGDDFLSVNSDQLDVAYAAIYYWDGSAWDTYTGESGSQFFQYGQGFFVKSKTGGGTVSFLTTMQSHQPTVSIKSLAGDFYSFSLQAKLGEKEKNTSVYFRNDMTLGLDVTFDVGLRKVNQDFEVYSKLIEGYQEVDFQHQALPGGYREYPGPFYHIKEYGYWWSATIAIDGALGRSLTYADNNIVNFDHFSRRGFSIRCLKD